MTRRKIAVVTVGRSDYGILRPILKRILADPALELKLIVGGMHLSPDFGLTVQEIEREKMPIAARVEMLESSDSPEAVARSMGRGLAGFAEAYLRLKPDWLLITGDRFEMFSAAAAAVPLNLPIAHLHGGEVSEGAIDEVFRHAITKMSHLHFVSTQRYRDRLLQMGEETWRVVVSGAPSLDNLTAFPLLSKEEMEARFGLKLERAPLLVTYHPVTREIERTQDQVKDLLAALEEIGLPVVFTSPNADPQEREILEGIQSSLEKHPDWQFIRHLGTQAYFSLMRLAAAMVGNSSSGLLEAPSFGLPVVNIGTRQQGRVRAENVIDVECGRQEIVEGIRKTLSPAFKEQARRGGNPYGNGNASGIIVEKIKQVELGPDLLMKRFVDRPVLDKEGALATRCG